MKLLFEREAAAVCRHVNVFHQLIIDQLFEREATAVCRHVNTSYQLIIDQLFECEATAVKQLFTQRSSGPLYPPSSFQVNFLFVFYMNLIVNH